MLLDDHTVITC